MRPTHDWKRLFAKLPKRLTYREVAVRLGIDYQIVRRAIKRHRYPALDGRRIWQNATRTIKPSDIDWRKSNIQIARELLVSRERVRQVRVKLGKKFVESRGRKAKGLPDGHRGNHP